MRYVQLYARWIFYVSKFDLSRTFYPSFVVVGVVVVVVIVVVVVVT